MDLHDVADQVLNLARGPQEVKNAEVFVGLVRALAGARSNYSYTAPSQQLMRAELIVALSSRLGADLRFGVPPVHPRTALISTITNKGWTLRVHSRISGSVSLMWDQSVGLGLIRIPARVRLERCLPDAASAVADYEAFLSQVGCHIRDLEEGRSSSVSQVALLGNIDQLGSIVLALAGSPHLREGDVV